MGACNSVTALVHVAEWEQHVSVPASVVSVSLVAPVSQSAVGRTGMTSER